MIRVIRSFRRNNTFWMETKALEFKNDFYSGNKLIVVNSKKTYQTHMGFGGVFANASYIRQCTGKSTRRNHCLYFSEQGLKYNLGHDNPFD